MNITYRDGARPGQGLVNTCSWVRLKEALELAAGCRPDETIEAVKTYEWGMSISICRKTDPGIRPIPEVTP